MNMLFNMLIFQTGVYWQNSIMLIKAKNQKITDNQNPTKSSVN